MARSLADKQLPAQEASPWLSLWGCVGGGTPSAPGPGSAVEERGEESAPACPPLLVAPFRSQAPRQRAGPRARAGAPRMRADQAPAAPPASLCPGLAARAKRATLPSMPALAKASCADGGYCVFSAGVTRRLCQAEG